MVRRLELRRRAERDPKFRAIALIQCKNDLVTFASDWCTGYDPRLVEREMSGFIPFDPFPKQVEFLRLLQDIIQGKGKDKEKRRGIRKLIGEKSRDTGLTVMCAIAMIWGWLFVPGFSGGWGSRKEDLVDSLGDPDSIFEKQRIVLYRLPEWMMPKGFNAKCDKHMLLRNPENGNTIKGEAGDNIGRGGRKSLYVVDEAAHIDHAQAVDSALSGNTNAIVKISSPWPNTIFAEQRFGGVWDVFTIHWTDDPRKDQKWHDDFLATWGEIVTAREVDLNYIAAGEVSSIPPEWVRACIRKTIRPPGQRIGRKVAGLDVAEHGLAESVLARRHGPTVLPLEAWNGVDTTQTTHRAGALCDQEGTEVVFFDSVGVGAGVSGTSRSTERSYKVKWVGVNWGQPPTPGAIDDAPDRPNPERFRNLRSQLYWAVRRRAEKTWEKSRGVKDWPDDECLELPDDNELIQQLSALRWEHTAEGKQALESKKAAATRGIKRLDRADGVVLSFADGAEIKLLIRRVGGGR